MGQRKALALFELRSISKGVSALDSAIKAAGAEPIAAAPLCPGRYMILLRGTVSEIAVINEIIERDYPGSLYDAFITGNISDGVFAALSGLGHHPAIGESLGFIETASASSALLAADTCAKAADITLIDIRLSQGLGGRSYAIISGTFDSVDEAVRQGANTAVLNGALIGSLVLPSPHPELYSTF